MLLLPLCLLGFVCWRALLVPRRNHFAFGLKSGCLDDASEIGALRECQKVWKKYRDDVDPDMVKLDAIKYVYELNDRIQWLIQAKGCFDYPSPRAHGPAVAALAAFYGKGKNVSVEKQKYDPSLKNVSKAEIQDQFNSENEKIASLIEGKELRKVIVVPGKLVNFVV